MWALVVCCWCPALPSNLLSGRPGQRLHLGQEVDGVTAQYGSTELDKLACLR